MQTDLITKVYFNEHLTHSCVGMPQGLQALLSSFINFNMVSFICLYELMKEYRLLNNIDAIFS